MANYSKYNIVYRLQKWIDSVPGQTFLNYAYSWGAAIVILGTLFKLTHLPGANIMIFIGMGTEVCVFFISAFDRPFDKTTEGQELSIHFEDEEEPTDDTEQVKSALTKNNVIKASEVKPNLVPTNASTPIYNNVEIEPHHAQSILEAQQNYVDELNKLTLLLAQVAEQSAKLAKDSEEMDNLNRTITGITKVYEIQLKSASKQMGTIDEINIQSAKMAEQIEQLNRIYARMIEAMTINMRVASTNGTENNKL